MEQQAATGFYGVPNNLSLSPRLIITEFHEFRPRPPMRKAGRRLGSWSNRFYEPAWLVSGYRESDGLPNKRRLFKVSRIRSQVHPEAVVKAMRAGVLPSDLEEEAIMAWNGDELPQ